MPDWHPPRSQLDTWFYAMSKGMDIRLKSIQPKAIWGCRSLPDKKSLVAIGDYEYVAAIGTGIMIFDNNPHGVRKTYMVNSHNPDVVCVTQIVLSADSKYLATAVKLKNEDDCTVHLLVYTIEYLRVEYRSPRLITYKNSSYVVGAEKLNLNCVSFSHDSQYIALGTNMAQVGVVILDHKKGEVFQVISTNTPPSCITFNPLDPCKLCVTGSGGLFQFWRFTNKSVHLAPVVGLRGHSLNYGHHIWIPPFSDGLVIASTTSGLLSIVLGGEQKGHNVHVFGQPNAAHSKDVPAKDSRPDEHAILQILVRGDVILAISPYNEVVALEVRRVLQSKGINTLSPTLGLLKRYRLSNIEELLGIDWCIRDSVTSFAVVGMSSQSVFQVEVIGDIDLEVSGGAVDAVKDAVGGGGGGGGGSAAEWVSIANEQSIFKYHGGEVHSLSVSARTNALITSSYTDSTVRLWNYNVPSSYRGSSVVESFLDRPQENPFHVDMHPSGLVLMAAVEGEVREYAVTDEHLELYRRVNIKGPFNGPTGTAHMITHPVSIVKYSNAGQFFVVVTGKLAQVFSVNVLDYTHSGGGGFPSRVMVICDHIAPITDVDFNRDDSRIITTSSDGCIYYWKVGALTRDQEYVFKGMTVNKVALSKNSKKETHIVALCENHNELLGQHQGPAEAMLMRRQSTMMQRRNTRSIDAAAIAADALAFTHNSTSYGPSDVPTMYLGLDRDQSSSSLGRRAPASVAVAQHASRKTFLAVWKDGLSETAPRVISLESEARCIALGDTDGPDKFDICVLGMADGRILITVLPFPGTFHRMIDVQVAATITHMPPSPSPEPHVKTQARRHKGFLASGSDVPAAMMSKAGRKVSGLFTQYENPAQDATVTTVTTARTATDADSSVMSLGLSGRHQHQHQQANKDSDDLSLPSRQSGAFDAQDFATALNTDRSGVPAMAAKDAVQTEYLDEARCHQLRMHCGPVSVVTISRNGMWVFSAGTDGVVHMYATSKKALELMEVPVPSDTFENRFHLVEGSKLRALRHQLNDTERLIESNKKDYDLKVEKILESKDKMVQDLQARMQKEVKQRDEAILHSRNEYLKLKTGMNGEIAAIRKQCNDSICELELTYEQKLSQESLYLDKMKQAYDEYVVHSRMDLSELQRRTDSRVENIEADKNAALMDAEKQKKTVLQYFEYVKLRNDEVMQSMEQTQVEERCKLKDELMSTAKQLEKAQSHLLTGEVQANREVSKLQLVIEEKENDVLKLRSSVDWSQNRIIELEQALHKATTELGVRTEMSEKWELKTGEMQQKIIELEKLRKALTTQLHSLRQELGPKEESLMRVTEKLQETDREYELSLQAIAEKEKSLGQKSENLNLLQKQVRDLRNATSRKEKVLRRAAILLDEYKFSLEQAYYKSEKRTLPAHDRHVADSAANLVVAAADSAAHGSGLVGKKKLDKSTAAAGAVVPPTTVSNEVVEIIAQNDGMKAALKRLSDILTPFLNDENNDAEIMDEQEQVRVEQERHMYLLHRNVTGLRANLDLAHTVAANKVQNHLNDNQNLLKEVNNLRFEVRNLSMENQRLASQLEFNSRMQGGRKKGGDSAEGSEMEPMFPQYSPQNYEEQQQQQQRVGQGRAPSQQAPPRINWDMVESEASDGPLLTAEMPSYDSNGNRNDAGFFSKMRNGSRSGGSGGGGGGGGGGGEVGGKARRGPKGAVPKHINKSASAPFFSVKGVHGDAQAALGATVTGGAMYPPEERGVGGRSGAPSEYSVGSKRTITGVPSYVSQLDNNSSSILSNKNEYVRSADDKIAALMELNEQQIRASRDEQNRQNKSSASSVSRGSKSKPIHMQSVTPDFSRGDVSLELLGGPAPVEGHGIADGLALNFSLTSDGSSAVQLPNIRKSTSNSTYSKRK